MKFFLPSLHFFLCTFIVIFPLAAITTPTPHYNILHKIQANQEKQDLKKSEMMEFQPYNFSLNKSIRTNLFCISVIRLKPDQTLPEKPPEFVLTEYEPNKNTGSAQKSLAIVCQEKPEKVFKGKVCRIPVVFFL